MSASDILTAAMALVPPILCLGCAGMFLLVLFALRALDREEHDAKVFVLCWLAVLSIIGGVLWSMM